MQRLFCRQSQQYERENKFQLFSRRHFCEILEFKMYQSSLSEELYIAIIGDNSSPHIFPLGLWIHLQGLDFQSYPIATAYTTVLHWKLRVSTTALCLWEIFAQRSPFAP